MLQRSTKVIPPMIARWDVLLVAAVLSGGSMLIESSHRIDTGLADDAMAPTCTEPGAAATGARDDASDARFSVSAADDDASPTCD
jgi:hypothetical protein